MLALLASFASVALASTTSTAPRESLSAVLARGEDVHASSLVGPIDGVTVPSYAGFFEVNATAHANHFFWYWPALNGNTSAPLLVWMQGASISLATYRLVAKRNATRRTFRHHASSAPDAPLLFCGFLTISSLHSIPQVALARRVCLAFLQNTARTD